MPVADHHPDLSPQPSSSSSSPPGPPLGNLFPKLRILLFLSHLLRALHTNLRNMATPLLIALACLLICYLSLKLLLHLTQDKQEPRAILTGIPFITPLIRMAREKDSFYTRVRDETGLPIYTIRLPFSKRIYIVNATELISPVQKQWRPISFAAITASAGSVVGASPEAVEVMKKDLMSDKGYSVSWPKQIVPTLNPGPMLDEMNKVSGQILVSRFKTINTAATAHNLSPATTRPVRIDLAEWARDMLISSTGDAVWGPQNPLKDPKVRSAWRIFEDGYLKLQFLPMPIPRLLFPKLFRAREYAAAAWTEYTRNKGYKQGSGLVQKFWEHHNGQFGMNEEDFGRNEVGSAFAILSNMIPCAFWVLYHVFSDEKVASDIRGELAQTVVREVVDEKGEKVSVIDLARLREENCPILMSTFQEVLRHRSVGASARVLLEDVLLDGRYLLKKGNFVMIPAAVQHTDRTAWGEDCLQFDHLRFVRGKQEGKKGGPRVSMAAFRSWGGGREMCPGRHYATTQILSLVALLALQYEVIPVGKGGQELGVWKEPEYEGSPAHGFPHLKQDFIVELRLLDPSRKWKVALAGDKAADVL